MTNDKPKWDAPDNTASSQLYEAGELALKHGITPDRAQMLIDRFGHDAALLDAAAEKLKRK